jgi:hypothetical protein
VGKVERPERRAASHFSVAILKFIHTPKKQLTLSITAKATLLRWLLFLRHFDALG